MRGKGRSEAIYVYKPGSLRHNTKGEPLMYTLLQLRIICEGARVCLYALAFLYMSSCNLMGNDNIPTHFEPVAWKDSMIFLATNEGPAQVQIWAGPSLEIGRAHV